jgi:hypothetical protein
MLTIVLLATLMAFSAEKSAFEQALESNQSIETRERWTSIDGVQYREIEYEGERFYVRFRNPEDKRARDTAELNCGLKSSSAEPARMEAGFKVTRRTRAFIQLFRETCVTVNGRGKTEVQLDPRIGFTLPEDSKSVIKNKKVYLTPTSPGGVGFTGDW